MKPSKKKILLDARKKDLSENPPVSKIKSFFKVAPKQFNLKNKINDVIQSDNSKAVYIQALEDKLKNFECKDAPDQGEASEGEEGAVGYDTNMNPNLLLNTVDINAVSGVANIELDSIVIPICTGCIQKTADYKGLDEKYKALKNVIESDSIVAPDCTVCIQKTADYKELDEKHKALKKVYFTLTSHYTELHLKYEASLKAKSYMNEVHIDGEAASTDDLFTKHELKFLQSMPLERKKDSTFILQCLEFAYKNNLSVLRTKTLKGKAESTKFSDEGSIQNIPEKGALTPIKVIRIKELFLERLSKCDIDSVVYAERVKESNINKLIASGVKNVAKKQPE